MTDKKPEIISVNRCRQLLDFYGPVRLYQDGEYASAILGPDIDQGEGHITAIQTLEHPYHAQMRAFNLLQERCDAVLHYRISD